MHRPTTSPLYMHVIFFLSTQSSKSVRRTGMAAHSSGYTRRYHWRIQPGLHFVWLDFKQTQEAPLRRERRHISKAPIT